MTAAAVGFEATFYNPAGLAFGERREVTFGYLRIVPDLSINTRSGSQNQDIRNPDMLVVGAAVPIGKYFALGHSTYFLPDTLLLELVNGPEDPFFAYYSNRTQRFTVMPAMAVRPFDWLAVGVGMNFLAGLSGTVSADEGPTREIEANVSEELPSRVGLHAGLRVAPGSLLSFGFAYRQDFRVPFATTTSSQIAGQTVDIDIDARTLETPHELAFGVAVDHAELSLSFDGTYLRWSRARGPFVRVSSNVSGVRIEQPPPENPFVDTFNLRLGVAVDHRLSDELVVTYRGGQHYEPSFLSPQTGRANLVDGDKLGFSGGIGLTFLDVLPGQFRLDAHGQVTSVLTRRFDKVVSTPAQARTDPNALADDETAPGFQTNNPGFPFVAGGGRVYTLGATVTFEVDP